MTKTKTKTKKKQANKQKKERNLSFKSLSHGWTLHLHRERNANSWHSSFVPCNSFHNVTEIWTLRSSSLKGMSVKGGPFSLLLSEQRYTRVLSRNVLMTQFIYRNLCFFCFCYCSQFFVSASAIRGYPVLLLRTSPLLANFLSFLPCLQEQPRLNALRMSTKFNTRSAFYLRSSI